MIHSGTVAYHDDLQPLLKPIDSVARHPGNYNQGDVEAIEESIVINGMYRPVYVQKSTGYIIAGNHTWEVCKAAGAEVIPIVVLDVEDTTAFRIMLADNRTAALAIPDHTQLVKILEALAADDSLLGTGYKDYDLETLRHLAEMELEYDEYASWPTLCFQLPPHVVKAFHQMTENAIGDRERFLLMMRLAGWTKGK